MAGVDASAAEPLVVVAVRFMAYTLALGGALALLPAMVLRGDVAIFQEGGLIEWAQLAVLLLAACGFALGAAWIRRFRECFVCLALAMLWACVRELDSTLDALIPFHGWKLPASAVAVCGALVAWKGRRRLVAQLREFVTYRGFALVWAGLAVAVLFAQQVGHGEFLRGLMGDDYVRDYKRVIEEIAELFGYLLLLIASIESVSQAAASRGALPTGAAGQGD